MNAEERGDVEMGKWGNGSRGPNTPAPQHPKSFSPLAYASFVVDGIAAKLEKAGRGEPRQKALWLVNHVTGVEFGDILTRGLKPMIREQWDALGALLQRVADGEPVQYVVGNTDFRGRVFQCDKRALIPRPETEELVDLALGAVRKPGTDAPRIVDVGTGTGCIAISLALEQPGAHVLATEISPDALALARQNAGLLGAEVDFRETDLLAGIASGSLDLVVSNPPYVGLCEKHRMDADVLAHEPASALFAGEDGLDVIRRLLPQAAQALRPGGRLLLEIGDEQGPAVRALLETEGWNDIAIRKDLAGRDRFADARKSGKSGSDLYI